MRRLFLGACLLSGAVSAACASATAKTPPEKPPLEVPAPPTKVVEPSPKPEVLEPVQELPPSQPNTTRSARQPAREPARTDPKPDAPVTTEPPPVPTPPVTPAPQLRSGTTPEPTEAAKQAQISIDRASKALSSVPSKARRDVYQNAKLMLASAEDAFKKSDFDNARKLADKVADTARELGGRD